MTPQTRLGSALNRLAIGTGAVRVRSADHARAERNGNPERDKRLEDAVAKFEAAADELWAALGISR